MPQKKSKKPTRAKPKAKPAAKKKNTKKKRSKKVPLIITIIILLLIGGGLFYVLTNINMIVKTAIEKYGSEAVKTAVRVQGVDIKLKEGSAYFEGLTVANPKGFDAKHVFSLGKIGAGIDLKSMTRDVKIINDITVKAPEIFAEVNKDNKLNLNELKKNLGAPPPKKEKEKQSDSAKPPPKIIIRKIHFSKGQIHSTVVPLNKKYDLSLPAFEMRNLGAPNGATPNKIAAQVLKELTRRSISAVRKSTTDQYTKELENKAKSTIENEAKKKLNNLF